MTQRSIWGLVPLVFTLAIVGVAQIGRGLEPPAPPAGDRVAAADTPPPAAPPAHDALQHEPRYIGVRSCAASNCHGGAGLTKDPKYASYLTWELNDPHAQAYNVLWNDLSDQIVRNLAAGAKEYRPAYKDRRCLACHSVNFDDDGEPLKERTHPNRHFQVSDGISCEACHGPAEQWIGPHTAADWNRRPSTPNSNEPGTSPDLAAKSSFGFRNTKNLLTRARMCAECHIGAEGMDVNHDLIAAGHPRLDFEFSSFHAQLPKHWDEFSSPDAAESQAQADLFEAKSWLVGQLASAEAAANLLATRAHDDSPMWPEFAEYGCFACHHNLRHENWRQKRGSTGRYPWGTWHFSTAPSIGSLQMNSTAPFPDPAAFATLQNEMGNVYPDPKLVRSQARKLSTEIAHFANGLDYKQMTRADALRLLQQLTEHSRSARTQNWEASAQWYLAIVSAARAAHGRKNDSDTVFDSLSELRRALLFPANFNSPLGFEIRGTDDPHSKQEQDPDEAWQKLDAALGASKPSRDQESR